MSYATNLRDHLANEILDKIMFTDGTYDQFVFDKMMADALDARIDFLAEKAYGE